MVAKHLIDLVGVLGISINSKLCTLVEITQNPNEPAFRVTMKDTFDQPILNYSSLLKVKVFPSKDSYDKQESYKKLCAREVKVPKITNKGNGVYGFSTTCDTSVHTTKRYPGHYYGHWQQEVATPQ